MAKPSRPANDLRTLCELQACSFMMCCRLSLLTRCLIRVHSTRLEIINMSFYDILVLNVDGQRSTIQQHIKRALFHHRHRNRRSFMLIEWKSVFVS